MINLNKLNSNLRIISICNNMKEFEEALKMFFVDVILIDAENIRYNELLHSKLIQLKMNSVIFISNNNISKEELDNFCICRYIIGKTKYKKINSLLCEFLSLQMDEKQCKDMLERKIIIEKIRKELIYLNARNSYNGFKYLIEAIYMLYRLENYEKFNLEKDIYSVIAKKYRKPIDTIKSDINYSVRILYLECEEEKLAEYLEEYNLYIPSTKKIILAILRKIKNSDTNNLSLANSNF